MKYAKPFLCTVLLSALFQCLETQAQYIVREGDMEGEIHSRTVAIPYFFSTETLGFGLGVGGSYSPKSNPQSMYYGTMYVTDNGSWLGLLGGYNLKLPHLDRLYIRPYGIASQSTHMRIYADATPGGNPGFEGGPPAGSNESDPENYVEVDAHDVQLSMEMRYILPLGHYRDEAVHTYVTENGLLKENPSGATSLNPLTSGQTSILFKPYYRKQYTDAVGLETLYFQLGAEHDNRDFIPNPHKGYRTKFNITHDPDLLADTRKWTSLEGEIDGFIPLPDTSWSRQQTLALSWWSSYSPTYDSNSTDLEGKPPYFVGATLGGLWRLRGFEANRFHDKAAIHYAAEYRVVPEWQPFGRFRTLDPLDVRWWQIVALAEAGRVAPEWNFETLHTDMKYDFGLGVRFMMGSAVGRLDYVISKEGASIAVMFGQTF